MLSYLLLKMVSIVHILYILTCGTGLATHEVAQEYVNETALTVYVPFKKKEEDYLFFR